MLHYMTTNDHDQVFFYTVLKIKVKGKGPNSASHICFSLHV